MLAGLSILMTAHCALLNNSIRNVKLHIFSKLYILFLMDRYDMNHLGMPFIQHSSGFFEIFENVFKRLNKKGIANGAYTSRNLLKRSENMLLFPYLC
jgi:hypothetical protein